MPFPSAELAVREDLFTPEEDLVKKYPPVLVQRLLRLRDMYAWFLSNPSAADRQFVTELTSRHGISTRLAYEDLRIIKTVLPKLGEAGREFHRWRFNQMIGETYQMAKARKDTKTMEKAASSYAKYNRVDVEDEMTIPYDKIMVQPFTATQDPTVLGIKPVPNIERKIRDLIRKYSAESMDIQDIECEEVDIEENLLFAPQEAEDPVTTDESPLRDSLDESPFVPYMN